ncbi:heparin binding hemagglutinin HbhA [Actinopolyspora mzabensis]|uniref:Heparin binding hemagglutinin HbhA n=1 Tax=Actinopolyspora mzabensis TaxID=995066 RepID=A0A1G8WY43_ACTMZ|nr:hypothetical protein [Actinopolyspora mzabensis]SDJ82470.1 heparin binding hemagglutinin HbhA [Actinopolyspora mzabensis]
MATRTDNSETEQPGGRAGQAAENLYKQARMPLVAALGAGEVAAHAVADSVHRVREQLNEHAGSARETVSELPSDLGELRDRIRSGDLRELLDNYRDSAAKLYGYFGERGEDALQRLRAQPGVRSAKSQVEHAQERFEGAVGEARELADDVLGRVSTTTRSSGEKAARTTETVAEESAETVRETGKRAASETRGATRRTANRASTAKSGDRTGSGSSGRTGSASGSSAGGSSAGGSSGSGSSASGSSGGGSRSGGQRGSTAGRNNPSKQPKSAARNKEQS